MLIEFQKYNIIAVDIVNISDYDKVQPFSAVFIGKQISIAY